MLSTHIKVIIHSSNRVKSAKLLKCFILRVPKHILLKSHKEYPAPSTMPHADITAETGERAISPKKTNISPTKLLVPGNPMFASEKNRKNAENAGITCVSPP